MSPSGRFAGLALIPLSMFLSGCVVGPNYSKVKVNAPAVFRGAEGDGSASFHRRLALVGCFQGRDP